MRPRFPFAHARAFRHGCVVALACVVVLSIAGGGLVTAHPSTQSIEEASTEGERVDTGTATILDGPTPSAMVGDDDSVGQESNLSVTIQVPRQIVTNVSLNYSVRTSGAEGNVTVEWDFDGETKTGTDVAHSFEEAGNATIEVTVTDESGSEVTDSVTVSVVNLADDESSNPIDNVGTIAVFFFGLIGVPLILLIVVLPKAMEVITDGL